MNSGTMANQNSRLDYTSRFCPNKAKTSIDQSQGDASALRYHNVYEDNNRSPNDYEDNRETMKSFNANEVSSLADPLLNLSQLDPKDLYAIFLFPI